MFYLLENREFVVPICSAQFVAHNYIMDKVIVARGTVNCSIGIKNLKMAKV
jgi:hypothetical protein